MRILINEEDDLSSTVKGSSVSQVKPLEDTIQVFKNEHSLIQTQELKEDIEKNDYVERYQKNYKELVKINSLIDHRYRYCTKWMEFSLATNVIFSITFMIYFMNPTDQPYDSIVFLGEILFLVNSFCFGYGIMAIYQRCPLKTRYFLKLLYMNLFGNLFLAIWLVYLKEQLGVIPSAFGCFSNIIVLVTGRGIVSYFFKRKEIYTRIQPIAETHSLSLNPEV